MQGGVGGGGGGVKKRFLICLHMLHILTASALFIILPLLVLTLIDINATHSAAIDIHMFHLREYNDNIIRHRKC